MTSTTSAFLPAASRAGTAEYSADTSASRSAGDSSETRSFEELCPEERGRRDDTDLRETPRDAAESALADEDAAAPSDEATGNPADETEEHDEDHTDESSPTGLPSLVSPAIIQTLLASLRGATPVAVVDPASGDPAENAATATPTTANAAQVRADGRSAPTAGSDTAATMRRQGRSARSSEGSSLEGGLATNSSAAAASPRATAKDAATAASLGAVAAKTKATPAEDIAAQPVVARLMHGRGHAEKSAGQAAIAPVAQAVAGQNKFLHADNQELAVSTRSAGTRTALSGGTMSSSTTTAQRHFESPVFVTPSQAATGQGASTETLSVDWKGWTNGGGERASSAAQFSQLGEKLSQIGIAATPATSAVARAATPVMAPATPAAPTVPADAAEALAPIHSAIERLVLHGREQLALTVRFEQGGSLSIKLAMRQGEIATQIQTDVPGLEAALKSAWGELAQDWNSRGWKLGQPEFASSAASYHSREDATADGRGAGRQAREHGEETSAFGGRAFSPARLKHSGPVTLSGLDALRAAAMARRGIHTWA